uniref:Uncharacterized protein n=1 Tax=Lepisosteus oculatus TaxID=7918 RepID=W5MZB0_LEPOC
MSSKDKDSLKNELLYLIYQHLSENGYKKAANEVKKHVLQKGSPVLSASLQDIYTSWMKAPENLNKRKLEEGALGSPVKRPRQSDPVSSSESSEDEKTDKKPVKGKVNLSSPGKPAKKPPSPGKKTLSSGSSDTSDSEAEQKPPGKASDKPAPVLSASKATKDSSSSSSEETDSEEELQKVPQKAVGTSKTSAPSATPAQATPKTPESSGSDSESSSESEQEAPAPQSLVKAQIYFFTMQCAKCACDVITSDLYCNILSQKTLGCLSAKSQSSSKPVPGKVSTLKSPLKSTKPTSSLAKLAPAVEKKPDSTESDSGSSETEEEAPKQAQLRSPAKATPKTPWVDKEVKSTESGSSDSSLESEEEKPAAKTQQKLDLSSAVKNSTTKSPAVKPAAVNPELTGSESEESSDTEQNVSQKSLQRQKAQAVKTPAPVPKTALKTSTKSTLGKPEAVKAHLGKVSKATDMKAPANLLKATAKSAVQKQSSESVSSDSSESEDETPQKKAITPKQSATSHALPVKPSAESDSSSSEDEPSQKKAGTAEESKSKDPDPPASAKAKSEDSTTDSSTDLEHRQPPAKMPKATPKKISSHAVPKKKNTSKSDSSSEDSSDDEEQSRNPAAKAGHKKTATATKGTKKPSPLAAPVPPNNESDSDS